MRENCDFQASAFCFFKQNNEQRKQQRGHNDHWNALHKVHISKIARERNINGHILVCHSDWLKIYFLVGANEDII